LFYRLTDHKRRRTGNGDKGRRQCGYAGNDPRKKTGLDYSLYDAKKYSSFEQLRYEINTAGFELVLGEWGDSPHYFRRLNLNPAV
jgi:hypothetical protein